MGGKKKQSKASTGAQAARNDRSDGGPAEAVRTEDDAERRSNPDPEVTDGGDEPELQGAASGWAARVAAARTPEPSPRKSEAAPQTSVREKADAVAVSAVRAEEVDLDGRSLEEWREALLSSLKEPATTGAQSGQTKAAGWRQSVKDASRKLAMERIGRPSGEALLPMLARKVGLTDGEKASGEQAMVNEVEGAAETKPTKPLVQGWRRSMVRELQKPQRVKIASTLEQAASLTISRPRGALTPRITTSKQFSAEAIRKKWRDKHMKEDLFTASIHEVPGKWLQAQRAEVATEGPTVGRHRKVDHLGRGADYYKWLRQNSCLWFTGAALGGLMCAIWANEINYKKSEHAKLHGSVQSLALLFTALVSSGICLYHLVWFYHAEMCLLRIRGWKLPPGFTSRSLKSADLWWQFIRDILIIIPQPLPLLMATFTIHDSGLDRDSVYPVNVVLLSLMFMRIFFLPRFYGFCIANLHTDEHDVFFAMNDVVLDDAFLLKMTLMASLPAVLFVFSVQIVAYSYLMMMFERPTTEGPLQSYTNSVWLTIVTMTTVGYGDIYPTTRMGRVVAIAASYSAMVMIAISINLVQKHLALSRAEEKVVSLHERQTLFVEKRALAAELIYTTLRTNAERRRGERNRPQKRVLSGDEVRSKRPPSEASPSKTIPAFPGMTKDAVPMNYQSRGKPLPKGLLSAAQEADLDKPNLDGNVAMLQEDGSTEIVTCAVTPEQVAGRFHVEPSVLGGGGRGRPREAVVYGEQLPLGVIVAEEHWHLALQTFRQKQRELYQAERAQESDLVFSLSRVEYHLRASQEFIDAVEAQLSGTVRDLQQLVSDARAGRAAQA
jgi:hypothetical protein